MLQNEKQTDIQLEQLIAMVNCKIKDSKALPQITRQEVNSKQNNIKFCNQKQIAPPKTLRFKPWSGKQYDDTGEELKIIHEEIQGISQRDDEDEVDENQKVAVDNFSEFSNAAKHDQIGYFYKFQNNPVKLIKKLLDQNGFKYANTNKNWTLYWSSTIIKFETYQTLMPYQKVNHFPNSFHLTRKDLMNKCISKMQIRHGMSHFNFLPKTFILPQETDLLLEQMNKTPGITYIAKPHNRSQGKGITVTNQISTIYAKLQKYSSLIVSHYIANPLLINNLKFDLRIYVAITGVNPLRIYVYHQGLGRFATEQYDQTANDCENKKFQHLTNYSVNKKNTEFVKSQNDNQEYFGSKWSLSALKDFLSYSVGKDQTNQLFERIDDVIVKTILSAENILHTSFMSNAPYNNCCYQVLGFDILIDSNLKPWLMEVNMSPSMNSDSPLDIKIKGSMIADLLTMVGVSPLAERYLDGNHLRFDIKNYNKPDSKQVQLGPVQRFILKEVAAEKERRGDWRRLFPTNDRRYKQFLQVDRYFNRLVRDYENGQQELRASYGSVINQRQGLSCSKPPDIKYNYGSVNDKRRTQSREKAIKFSIRIQQKNGRKVHI